MGEVILKFGEVLKVSFVCATAEQSQLCRLVSVHISNHLVTVEYSRILSVPKVTIVTLVTDGVTIRMVWMRKQLTH